MANTGKAGRNDACPCGSGKKYKKCCEGLRESAAPIPADFSPILEQAQVAFNRKNFQEAESICMQVLQINPFYSDALYILGVTRHAIGQTPVGIMLLEKAIASNGNIAAYHFNLGAMLEGQKNFARAIECYRRVLTIDPHFAAALKSLGGIYIALNDYPRAITCYNEMRALNPLLYDEEIQHRLAALQDQTTEKAPEGYVKTLFNYYAKEFEQHLTHELGYHIPEITASLVKEALPSSPREIQVLDLGCGTGLSGEALQKAGIACRLTGVDLADKMLEKAAEKQIYAELHNQDIAKFLQTATGSYAVILAEDVFIYIGKLDELFKEMARLLAPGAIFAFSIEKSEDEASYSLRKSARYAHRESYIAKLCTDYHFTVKRQEAVPIRQENGTTIPGIIFLLTRS